MTKPVTFAPGSRLMLSHRTHLNVLRNEIIRATPDRPPRHSWFAPAVLAIVVAVAAWWVVV